MILDIGSAMAHLGLNISNEAFIGIYGSATIYYALFLYSSWCYSFVPVGIYDSLGHDGVQFIIKHANLKLIFADNLKRVHNLIECHDESSSLETIVSLSEPSLDLIEIAKAKGIRLVTYTTMMDLGKTHRIEPVPPELTDTAVIMYTSGSTGEPKGCIITHESFICAAAGIILMLNVKDEAPRILNFMPLAHMFGCSTIVIATSMGGEIGFWQGNTNKLINEFNDFKPNLLTMVPRLLNKLYDTVMSETSRKDHLSKSKVAIQSKLTEIRKGNFSCDTIWDQQIFNQIRSMFGNKIERVVVSSAPLALEVADFFRAVFSCTFIECYGQTECIMGCWQSPNDTQSRETGIPTPVNHIKLIDIPEMGYLKDEAKTHATIDDAGWLRTGDVGRWTTNNAMQIIDRHKNIYKLSQGEFIAPEKIEGIYGRSQFISQVYVYGDSLQNFPIAIVLLDDDFVQKWTAENDNDSIVLDTDESKRQLTEIVLKDMIEKGK
ncbi:unnamed protein product [Rotaria magnacalcarata]|uniref:long-chain-fatty-acid--CoA ligase n=5 Tax=Rotaria magnacalcarata TaxID=392030 RepID=A0A815E1K2_9BILA|nr:unnamed protein product [Rotaria magnacalcarata]